MERNRRGEDGRAPFRTGRFFCVNGRWFFATREGGDYGPYRSRAEAEAALTNFVRNHSFEFTRASERPRFLHDKDKTGDAPGQGYRFYW